MKPKFFENITSKDQKIERKLKLLLTDQAESNESAVMESHLGELVGKELRMDMRIRKHAPRCKLSSWISP